MKNELISAFEDTRKNSLGMLAEQTAVSQKNSRIYFENFEHSISMEDVLRNQQCTILVVEDSSFSAARKYLPYGKVAVLNFANPENPGGGVQNGAILEPTTGHKRSEVGILILLFYVKKNTKDLIPPMS